jgi:hypothetical protein
MKNVPDQTYIPSDTAEAIKARLRERVNQKLSEMDEDELRILDKSEKDFRDFVADIFMAISATFGYIVGVVIGTAEEIMEGITKGWKAGYGAGRRKRN